MDLIVLLQLSSVKPKHNIRFEAIGTHWSIETDDPLDGGVRQDIKTCIKQFDYTYSRFRHDSLVARLDVEPTTVQFPQSADALMILYRQLYDATDGRVTPLIGRQLVDAGYDTDYSFVASAIHTLPEWDAAMRWHGSSVQTHQPIVLDVGAAGKGLLVDEIAAILDKSEYGAYVIDASGDIRHKGTTCERIGLENPDDSSRVLGMAQLQNKSLCASAGNRRTWGKGMHHIFDPSTKQPVDTVRATWVVADDTMSADGLATALFFVDASKLSEWQFEYVRLLNSGTIERSENFIGELYA
ncbi:hypothetical protein A2707_03095 [Candidatus Saccharibacteria bacterium RIFCSPHIGHO2_01_FULL_45_15]|nr:MAG: hypothetical protein A2707_03095 [Candidatus Saccharibacteria bacterium RIFCSPHIGHO2_01_FULL_45_15]OGL28474.1 MAG: hypothetical protein A3C39_02965 [Candidatus Saccharibacteria bacterium RIFCSPHIGHO2_02_FULL_46_12]OGL32511.1 MAG: hypothetical protein A3E76_00475 [Candidatus Saccharibacteria bacterium RIFCSPHIGHO2_12_FULL_44_22]